MHFSFWALHRAQLWEFMMSVLPPWHGLMAVWEARFAIRRMFGEVAVCFVQLVCCGEYPGLTLVCRSRRRRLGTFLNFEIDELLDCDF